MQLETRMPAKPRYHTWMVVCSIIVDDEMQIKTCWSFIVYLLEESNKLLMSVTRHAVTYYFSIKHAQYLKQCGCAVAFVIMGLCPGIEFWKKSVFSRCAHILGFYPNVNLRSLINFPYAAIIQFLFY